MKPIKLLALLSTWGLVIYLAGRVVPRLPDLFEPRTRLFVLAFPWLLSFAGLGPGRVLQALRDSLTARACDLPSDQRIQSARIVRRLGSLSLSSGVVAFLVSTIAGMNAVATSGGEANPMEFIARAPTAFLAPIFGYMLQSFVYSPLAAALQDEESGLGMEPEG